MTPPRLLAETLRRPGRFRRRMEPAFLFIFVLGVMMIILGIAGCGAHPLTNEEASRVTAQLLTQRIQSEVTGYVDRGREIGLENLIRDEILKTMNSTCQENH